MTTMNPQYVPIVAGTADGHFVAVSMYAGDWIVDSRQKGQSHKPPAYLRGSFTTLREARNHAEFLQARAGGQSANIVVEALSWDVANRRYTLSA